jgi:hypothetical protein
MLVGMITDIYSNNHRVERNSGPSDPMMPSPLSSHPFPTNKNEGASSAGRSIRASQTLHFFEFPRFGSSPVEKIRTVYSCSVFHFYNSASTTYVHRTRLLLLSKSQNVGCRNHFIHHIVDQKQKRKI